MERLAHFQAVLLHETKANAETLRNLRKAKSDTTRPRRLFAHIQAARELWLRRLRREAVGETNLYPDLSLDETEDAMLRMDLEWALQLETADPARLGDTLLYEDARGHFWSAKVIDAITEVFNHSTYHRGQIALLLRDAGDEPMRTGYILDRRRPEEG